MIKNYHPAERKLQTEFRLVFDDGEGCGFSFPCNKQGRLYPMAIAAKDNYYNCIAHPEWFVRYNVVESIDIVYREPAYGTCSCGAKVEFYDQYMGACECPDCGQWYNLFGQELNPPKYWYDEEQQCYRR